MSQINLCLPSIIHHFLHLHCVFVSDWILGDMVMSSVYRWHIKPGSFTCLVSSTPELCGIYDVFSHLFIFLPETFFATKICQLVCSYFYFYFF